MPIFTLQINGKEYKADVAPDTPILWVLRDHLGLVGTKFGCGIAQCGACTIHFDGNAVRSCMLPVSAAKSAKKLVVRCSTNLAARIKTRAILAQSRT